MLIWTLLALSSLAFGFDVRTESALEYDYQVRKQGYVIVDGVVGQWRWNSHIGQTEFMSMTQIQYQEKRETEELATERNCTVPETKAGYIMVSESGNAALIPQNEFRQALKSGYRCETKDERKNRFRSYLPWYKRLFN